MRDRRQGRGAGTLAEAADRALREMADALPPEKRAAFVAGARAQIGMVLSEAPMGEGGGVEEIALRAALAAALGASSPDGET